MHKNQNFDKVRNVVFMSFVSMVSPDQLGDTTMSFSASSGPTDPKLPKVQSNEDPVTSSINEEVLKIEVNLGEPDQSEIAASRLASVINNGRLTNQVARIELDLDKVRFIDENLRGVVFKLLAKAREKEFPSVLITNINPEVASQFKTWKLMNDAGESPHLEKASFKLAPFKLAP